MKKQNYDSFSDISPEKNKGVLKKVLKEGKGPFPGPPGDGFLQAKVIMTGSLVENGTKFSEPPADKGYERIVLGVGERTRGVDIAILSMRVGERAQFVIEPSHGFSNETIEGVPPHSTVIFDIELLGVKIPKKKYYELPKEERKTRAAELKTKGAELFNAGDIAGALKMFNRASLHGSVIDAAMDKDFVAQIRVPSLLNESLCHFKLGDAKSSLERADAALKLDPKSAKGHFRRAQGLRELGRVDEAKKAIIQAIQIAPEKKDLRQELEIIQRARGKSVAQEKQIYGKMMEGSSGQQQSSSGSQAGSASLKNAFSEIVYGFTLIALFTTFFAQVWFFPLDNMDISGYEVVAVVIFFPAFLGISFLKRLFQYQFFNVVAAVGILVCGFVQRLLPRTLIIAGSLTLSLLSMSARFGSVGRWLGISFFLTMLDRLWGLNRSSVWAYREAAIGLLVLSILSWIIGSKHRQEPSSKRFSFIVALSIGSIFFVLTWFAHDPNVWSRWLNFRPYPLAFIVMSSCLAGFVIPFPSNRVLASIISVVPFASASWILKQPNYTGVALFMFSTSWLWYPMVSHTSTRPTGSTLFSIMLVWFLHFLGSIWTVAYNFVPFFGTITREQTHVHLLIAAFLSGLGVAIYGPGKRDRSTSVRQFLIVGVVCALLMAPVVFHRQQVQDSIPSRAVKATADGEIRSMIWAVHFGYDNYGRNSFHHIESVIRENNVNVIGLLESDQSRLFTDNWDLMNYLENQLGYYADFGPSTLNNTWGCGLLSAFPIKHVERWMLPSPEGELSCIVDATLLVQGKDVHVVVVHFGNDRDVLDRQLQAEGVVDLIKRAPKGSPHLFLGYLTNRPYSTHYNMIVQAGWVDTAPTEYRRWCQYIFYRDLDLKKFYRYDTGFISDTEAQIAHVRLKKDA